MELVTGRHGRTDGGEDEDERGDELGQVGSEGGACEGFLQAD